MLKNLHFSLDIIFHIVALFGAFLTNGKRKGAQKKPTNQ